MSEEEFIEIQVVPKGGYGKIITRRVPRSDIKNQNSCYCNKLFVGNPENWRVRQQIPQPIQQDRYPRPIRELRRKMEKENKEQQKQSQQPQSQQEQRNQLRTSLKSFSSCIESFHTVDIEPSMM